MNTRSQLLCAWSGFVFALLFTLGFWPLAQFMPPPSPNLSAADVAAMYQAHTTQFRCGVVVMMVSAGLILPFVTAISVQMERMEGAPGILSKLQLVSGAVGVIFFIVPCLAWGMASFRPDRAADLILLLSDLGWISFLFAIATFIVQNLAIGFAILGDKNASPAYPRWMGYFTVWTAVLFLPGGMLLFFKTGPFAWNGLFVFWIPFVVFFVWYLLMFVYLRKAIIDQAAAAPGH